jgi:MoaA/NifB/PqqE/SkfB family radical SAM enzyme
MIALHSYCRLPFVKLQVYADGSVNQCCYQKSFLGNVLETPLEEIWFSELAREVRKTTLKGDLHRMCKGWGGCPFITLPREPKQWQVRHELPSYIELSLPNTHCNIGGESPAPETACFMCPRSAEDFWPDIDRTAELVARIKPMMPHLSLLSIVGLAEPFWKDAAFRVLEQLEFEKHNKRCGFSTFTNGTVLTPERQRRLVDLCPELYVQISLDAATPETYREIRRLDLFDRAVAHIESFLKIRRPGQFIRICNNINTKNVHECVEMVRQAKRLGVDGLTFNPTHNSGNDRAEVLPYLVNPGNAHLFRQAQRDAVAEASRIGMRIDFWRNLDLGIEPSPPSEREVLADRRNAPQVLVIEGIERHRLHDVEGDVV